MKPATLNWFLAGPFTIQYPTGKFKNKHVTIQYLNKYILELIHAYILFSLIFTFHTVHDKIRRKGIERQQVNNVSFSLRLKVIQGLEAGHHIVRFELTACRRSSYNV